MNLTKLQGVFFHFEKKGCLQTQVSFFVQSVPFLSSVRGAVQQLLCALCFDLDLQRLLHEVFGGASAFRFDVVTCCVPLPVIQCHVAFPKKEKKKKNSSIL